MLDGKLLMFENRLKKVLKIRSKEASRQKVSCYRLYDRDLPEFPLIIDVYENELLVTEYRSQHRLSHDEYIAWLDGSLLVVKKVLNKTDDQIHIKERKVKESRQDQYAKTASVNDFMVVHEGGLAFLVNLTDYLDTGLFLDHRITRSMVREKSNGKKVLNLFCYTASFSVYAAAGNAAEVVSVDLSNTYIDWARRNMELNGFEGDKYLYTRGDVLQILPTIQNNYFDIIILDPPTFSNSKSMKEIFDVQQMHVELINLCLDKLKYSGELVFSTNARKFHLEGEMIKGAVKEITSLISTTSTGTGWPYSF
ncbi:MAG: class I SAM-dependent methyltransferase [Chitinophagaceae bacterium]|nr:class I SAM-dependent methyltransferase [Chitinophagaceae bacterium]